jgi:hypothetical protein
MNLQENIHRIQSMMGVINEDNRPNVIKKMIDDLGIATTIKMVGNIDLIEPYLKEVDKTNYIKDKVAELGRGGVSLREIGEEPIFFDEVNDDHKQIGFLGRDRAYIDIYYRGHNVGDNRVVYESLPSQIVDEIFRMLVRK